MATYVLIHGAASDSWYWHRVTPELHSAAVGSIAFVRHQTDDRDMTVQDAVSVQALAARLGPNFTLGVASAAFQIEGSLAAGGRGPWSKRLVISSTSAPAVASPAHSAWS